MPPIEDLSEIRVLGATDVAMARAMLELFGRAFDERETYHTRQPDDAYLERLLAQDTFVAIVARVGNQVIGALAGYVLHKFEQARAELYIYDLAVDAAYRRRRIATALIERLKSLATARGIYVIFVQADPGDHPAIALYDKLGTREQVLHFDIAPAASVD